MEVRRGLGDVAQRGHLEHHLVGLVLGHVEAALVGAIGPRLDEARLLIQRAAEQIAHVTGGAADLHELVQARFFGVGQRGLVAT